VLTSRVLNIKITAVSRYALAFDKCGPFLEGIFSGWGIFVAEDDGAHIDEERANQCGSAECRNRWTLLQSPLRPL